jgi:hypothetical protein
MVGTQSPTGKQNDAGGEVTSQPGWQQGCLTTHPWGCSWEGDQQSRFPTEGPHGAHVLWQDTGRYTAWRVWQGVQRYSPPEFRPNGLGLTAGGGIQVLSSVKLNLQNNDLSS